jgi:predicted RNase H-like HicB family nuclease
MSGGAAGTATRCSVGLEEGSDGAVIVHAFTVPGCVGSGATPEEALEAFSTTLAEWLDFLSARGAELAGGEVEITVDEWVSSEAPVAGGESRALFEHDLLPLSEAEIAEGLQRLGDLRGPLLKQLRHTSAERLEAAGYGGWAPARILDELARAQWWTLTRLGASPLAEVPERLLGRLDTAMALVVQQFTTRGLAARAEPLELDGEAWTPRKVLRRLLWLEWALGGSALHALDGDER